MQRIVASWFGTGLILRRLRGSDSGSGTVSALFALPIAVWVGLNVSWLGQVGAAALVALLSLWAAKPFTDGHDPGWVTIDEAAGVFVAVIGLTTVPQIAIAWIVFRFADIFKTAAPGVAQAERIPGALGVTADDLVAGIYGLLAGHGVGFFL